MPRGRGEMLEFIVSVKIVRSFIWVSFVISFPICNQMLQNNGSVTVVTKTS